MRARSISLVADRTHETINEAVQRTNCLTSEAPPNFRAITNRRKLNTTSQTKTT